MGQGIGQGNIRVGLREGQGKEDGVVTSYFVGLLQVVFFVVSATKPLESNKLFAMKPDAVKPIILHRDFK